MPNAYGRRGGRREQRQDPSAGDDDVVDHLRDEVYGVVHKDDVLVAVDEVHDRLGGVAAGGRGKEHNSIAKNVWVIQMYIHTL